ncbi:11250_t:CDS:2, partial [Dentiscutata heterogama]
FDDEQGFVDGQNSDNEEGFVDEWGSNNEQNSGDELDFDSLNKDSQDPNNLLTWKFSKQVATFTSEEIEEIEMFFNTILILNLLDTLMQQFLKGVPLPELHPSLNNRSKIEHMIATRRHAEHPYSQDIMGVVYMLLKQKQDEKDNPYIRSIHMSFKRVHGPINEWEVCAYIEKYQKTLVFAHAFTILQTADTIGCILADEHYGQAL